MKNAGTKYHVPSKVSATTIRSLVKAVQPQMIYHHSAHLMIILSSGHTLPHKDYEKQIKKIRLPKKYSWALHQKSEIEKQFREGSLYIASNCIPENLVYAIDNQPIIPPWKKQQAVNAMAFGEFTAGQQKADLFLEGACFYWARREAAMAAFMLHQSVELCCRAVIMAFKAEEVRTHNIGELMQHLNVIAPEMSRWFKNLKSTHPQLITSMEQAYCQVRYSLTYHISEDSMQALITEASHLHGLAKQLMKDTFNAIDSSIKIHTQHEHIS